MPTFLDLFAGAGGLSEGFTRAGFTPVAHVEMDRAACNTLRTRETFHWLDGHGLRSVYDSYLRGEITRGELYSRVPADILARVIEKTIGDDTMDSIFQEINALRNGSGIDYVIGGPPCQAYSLAGRARDAHGMRGDPRNYLYRYYARFLERFRPRYFVFENVLGLRTATDWDGVRYFDKMKALFEDKGYAVHFRELNAKDYGIPQNRHRIILVGKLGADDEEFFPNLTKHPADVPVSRLLADLPKLHAGEGRIRPTELSGAPDSRLLQLGICESDEATTTYQIARPNTQRDLEIYRRAVKAWEKHTRLSYRDLPSNLQTQRNLNSFLDRFKVVAGDLPYSQTVVAHVCKDGHYFIHPDPSQNRSLTPREVARLQTFPDNYFFEGVKDGEPSRTAAYKQIGNAVPVRLAELIARALLEQDSRRDVPE